PPRRAAGRRAAGPPRRPTPRKPAPPAPAPAGPKPARRKRYWGRILAALLLLAGAGAVAGTFWLDSELQRIPALADYPGRPAAGAGTTWLLVGSDSRSDLTPEQQAQLSTGGDLGNGRTDTILLVHIPRLGSSTPTTVVSIPRDSYVEIPGYGSDKINAAYSLGGAPLLAQTVEQATGVRLDHYAEVGFAGFARLVDAVGGVTACPAEPIDDPLAGINLPAGCQELDGRTALGFVRSRATPRADLDRMANQRAFLSALLHRAASPSVWLNPLRWSPMAGAARAAVTVGAQDHVWNLARLAWSLRGDTTNVTVPLGTFSSNSSGSVVVWDDELAGALFTALRTDSPVPPSVLDAQP
ncbi:LCP family protein, partial [Mycolicibacterium hassiacum]|uniref:LCP family protein n=1 Tax=Mycolicibacterium hassiacum TaxID=46351 RepID=UPI0023FA3180